MNPRERVRIALEHKETDRVPIDMGSRISSVAVDTYNRLKRYLGINSPTEIIDWHQQIVRPDEKILQMFNVDIRYIHPKGASRDWKNGIPKNLEKRSDGIYYTDEWGLLRKKVGAYYEIVEPPLQSATIEELENYDWPDFSDSSRYEGLEKEAKKLYEDTEFAISTSPLMPIFQYCTFLRGLDKFLIDLMVNREFAIRLMDKVLELNIKFFNEFLDRIGKYLDLIIASADDIGTVNSTIISPEMYRELVKPRHAKLIQAIKRKTKAKIVFHSDGAVYPLIKDFIEIGVDVLNPVEPDLPGFEDFEKLKKELGSQICFYSGMKSQKVLLETSSDIEKEVRQRVRLLASGGGYIFASCHNIQAGVSPENICTFFKAIRRYGKYPV